jgi:hypothetical protein
MTRPMVTGDAYGLKRIYIAFLKKHEPPSHS